MIDFIKRLLGFKSKVSNCNHNLKLIGYLNEDNLKNDTKYFKYKCVNCNEVFYFDHAIDCIGCKYLWLNCCGEAECTNSALNEKACLSSHHRIYWDLDIESEKHDFGVEYKDEWHKFY